FYAGFRLTKLKPASYHISPGYLSTLPIHGWHLLQDAQGYNPAPVAHASGALPISHKAKHYGQPCTDNTNLPSATEDVAQTHHPAACREHSQLHWQYIVSKEHTMQYLFGII